VKGATFFSCHSPHCFPLPGGRFRRAPRHTQTKPPIHRSPLCRTPSLPGQLYFFSLKVAVFDAHHPNWPPFGTERLVLGFSSFKELPPVMVFPKTLAFRRSRLFHPPPLLVPYSASLVGCPWEFVVLFQSPPPRELYFRRQSDVLLIFFPPKWQEICPLTPFFFSEGVFGFKVSLGPK